MVEVPNREALHEGKFKFEEDLEQDIESRRTAEATVMPLPPPVVTDTVVDDIRVAPIRARAAGSIRPSVAAYGAPRTTTTYGVVGPYSDLATRSSVNYPLPSEIKRGAYVRPAGYRR
jgi:hypothetical protein